MSFENLKLDATLLQAIAACNFTAPTEIQSQAIPVALEGRDLMASAQTGTGKTAAFVLPALQRLLTPSTLKGRGPRVLVLTPTRELAAQITDNIRQFSRGLRITSGSVVGGMSYGPQIQLLKQPLDFLVATPGRLMDHMEQGRVDFSRLEVLVLDEADRMLDMGFVDAVKMISKATPESRQTLLFSATLEGRVLEIARQLLKDPVRIQLASNGDQHASIEQQVHEVDDSTHKHALLAHLLSNDALQQAVIFTATKRDADKLAQTLTERGHPSEALHGDMAQKARKRTIDRMKRGDFRLLVATDVASRGLDIKGISHVINFDLPMVAEDYIHRIGRTGRGGASGTAISLVDPEDRRLMKAIERLTGHRIERTVVPGFEPKQRGERGEGPRRDTSSAPRRNNNGPRPSISYAQPRSNTRSDAAAPRRDSRGPARSTEGNGNRSSTAAPRRPARQGTWVN